MDLINESERRLRAISLASYQTRQNSQRSQATRRNGQRCNFFIRHVKEAGEMYQRALKGYKKTLGPEHWFALANVA
jgi:uncharacterized protein (DUF2384 family)